jgi:hypothetical protein
LHGLLILPIGIISPALFEESFGFLGQSLASDRLLLRDAHLSIHRDRGDAKNAER